MMRVGIDVQENVYSRPPQYHRSDLVTDQKAAVLESGGKGSYI